MKADVGNQFVTIGHHQNVKHEWIKGQPEPAVTTTITWAMQLPDEVMEALHREFFFVDSVAIKSAPVNGRPSEIAPAVLNLIALEGNQGRLDTILSRLESQMFPNLVKLRTLHQTILREKNAYLWVPDQYVQAPTTDE